MCGGGRAKFQALRRVRAERHGLSELRGGRTLMSTTFLPSGSAIGRAIGERPSAATACERRREGVEAADELGLERLCTDGTRLVAPLQTGGSGYNPLNRGENHERKRTGRHPQSRHTPHGAALSTHFTRTYTT